MRRSFVFPAALGAGLMFFFDPESGNRRRVMARDRTTAFFRRLWRGTERAGRGVSAEAHGLAQKAKHLEEVPKDLDDATLAHKVETEIFRSEDAPKGTVNVNAENGVVYLRGEVERPDLLEELEQKARSVQGVKEVENLPDEALVGRGSTVQAWGKPRTGCARSAERYSATGWPCVFAAARLSGTSKSRRTSCPSPARPAGASCSRAARPATLASRRPSPSSASSAVPS
jgi:hypothetical protein